MPSQHDLRFGPFGVDLANERLWRGAQALRLRPKTFAVLRYFLEHPGHLISKDTLLQAVWPEVSVSEAALSVTLAELRKTLGDDPRVPQGIETVPRRGYRFIAPVLGAGAARADAGRTAGEDERGSASVVGREAELQRLHGWFEQALRGERQVVFVTGEPGIGKTTLVDAWLRRLAPTAALWLAWGQCVEHFGAGEAYLPVLDALGRLCQAPGGDRLLPLLRQHAPTWLGQLPTRLSAADLDALQPRVLGATQERMLREMAAALEAITAERPLVLVLKDLHWSDASTLELLAWLARRRERARLLLIGTYRPVDAIVRGHPLRAVTRELALHRQGAELPLEGLTAADVAQYLAQCFPGSEAPARLSGAIYRHTDGQPLFMVHVVDALVQRGALVEVAGQWEVRGEDANVTQDVPETLRQMIAQQLDRLSAEAERVLEAASVAGMTFVAAAVAAGLEAEEGAVEEWCESLARRGHFLLESGVETWPDGTVTVRYHFRHALYQQVLYERVPLGLRMRLHRRIGAREEAGYQERAGEHAAALALHFERGRDSRRAVPYRRQAAQNALRRGAYAEAVDHLTRGLETLKTWQDTPARTEQELALQVVLGSALNHMQGYAAPAVVQVFARARELCRQVGATPQLSAVLGGLTSYYRHRAELQTAHDLEAQWLSLAQRQGEAADLLRAHMSLGATLLWCGDLTRARTHLEQALALYDPAHHQGLAFQYGFDPWRGGCSLLAQVLWLLGYPAQALTWMERALSSTEGAEHPWTMAFALSLAARLHHFRREAALAQARSAAALALASAQGWPQIDAMGTLLQGWALAAQGQGGEGLTRLCRGLDLWRATGAALFQPYWLALLAEVARDSGQVEVARQALVDALAAIRCTGERWWEAELYRCQGELLLQGPQAQAQAEACLQQALKVARGQQAKALELRTAMSLARLWQHQGKRAEAGALLGPIYRWFTEGFDTADLIAAKALLE